MKHITDEQLDALKRELQYRVNERGAFPKDLSRQLLTAIQTFRSEREAHQVTQAKLDAAREVVDTARAVNRYLGTFIDMPMQVAMDLHRAIQEHDAACSGQEESDE